MREFDEVLRGSFDAHVGQIDGAGGGRSGLAARTVRDVRRKRAWRAGATGAISATAVVGVVATAIAFTGDGSGPADGRVPAAQPSATSDPYSLGACTAYIPANGALLPDGMYEGRAYVDSAVGFAVAVAPDGMVTRVQPGPDGDYPFDFGNGPRSLMPWAAQTVDVPPMVIEYMSDGTAGGAVWVDAAPVGWGWTVESGSPAPAGVNTRSLYKTFAGTLGFGGQGFDPRAIPAGAGAAVVAIYADGREVSTTLVSDFAGPVPSELDFDGLVAVALRVTMADGSFWEMRADYDPAGVPDLPCQPTPPSRVEAKATGEVEKSPVGESDAPSAPPAPNGGDTAVLGAPLSGPEVEVFQCSAPLPAELENTADLRARRATGAVSTGQSGLFTVGDDGLIVEGKMSMWRVSMDDALNTSSAPGWRSQAGGQADGSVRGNVSFIEIVALADGVIVAAAAQPLEDLSGAGGPGMGTFVSWGADSSTHLAGFLGAYNGVEGLLETCGVGANDRAGTQLAVIYGFGPSVDDVTYGWTRVEPAP